MLLTTRKEKKISACLLCLATLSLKTSSYFLCCASFGVPDHSGNYTAQMQPYGWRTAEGGCLKEKNQKVKTSVFFFFFFLCSQPEKVFFTLHIVHKQSLNRAKKAHKHGTAGVSVSECVISCPSRRIRSWRNPAFFFCQKEKCSLFLQTKLRQTCSGWAAFCGSSGSDVCASLPKMIIRLSENLLTGTVWTRCCHPSSLAVCFVVQAQSETFPQGVFRAPLHLLWLRLSKKDFQFYCAPDFNSISASSLTVFIL